MQHHSNEIDATVFGCGRPKRRVLMPIREIAQPQEEDEHRIEQEEPEESSIHTTNSHSAVGPLLREMCQRRRQNRRALLQQVELEQGELKQLFLPTVSEPADE
jgi:hypothetical protein